MKNTAVELIGKYTQITLKEGEKREIYSRVYTGNYKSFRVATKEEIQEVAERKLKEEQENENRY